MQLKKLAQIALLAVAATTAPKLMANTVELYAYSYEFGGGGEITAVSTPSFLANYAPSAIVNGGFETFCVEVAVDASINTPYSFTLSSQTTEGNQLSLGAAYLYYLFGKGALPGYNYADAPSSPDGSRLQDAEWLQTALWMLMNQPNYFGQDPNSDPYLQLAISNFGSYAAANAANNGAFPVDVMQLWDLNNAGSPGPLGYQDQLVLVPDGGSTALMLGVGFSLLSLVPIVKRRRMAAAAARSKQ